MSAISVIIVDNIVVALKGRVDIVNKILQVVGQSLMTQPEGLQFGDDSQRDTELYCEVIHPGRVSCTSVLVPAYSCYTPH